MRDYPRLPEITRDCPRLPLKGLCRKKTKTTCACIPTSAREDAHSAAFDRIQRSLLYSCRSHSRGSLHTTAGATRIHGGGGVQTRDAGARLCTPPPSRPEAGVLRL